MTARRPFDDDDPMLPMTSDSDGSWWPFLALTGAIVTWTLVAFLLFGGTR